MFPQIGVIAEDVELATVDIAVHMNSTEWLLNSCIRQEKCPLRVTDKRAVLSKFELAMVTIFAD